MFKNPSVIVRFEVGKIVGLLFGLAGFILTPYFLPDASMLFRWGILLWYVTVGGIVGIFGVLTYYPVPKLAFPWWAGAAFVGAWMNLVLTFFIYDAMQSMMVALFGEGGTLTSPFWFTAEGAIVGIIIGYFATRFGGEGKETLRR